MKPIGSLPPALLHALPERMVDELGALRLRRALTLAELRRLCAEHAPALERAGLVVEALPFTLAHLLQVEV